MTKASRIPPCDAKPEIDDAKYRDVFEEHQRLQELYRLSCRLLAWDEKLSEDRTEQQRRSKQAWNQVGGPDIDLAFFFRFDTVWIEKVQRLRQDYAGSHEPPFGLFRDAKAWAEGLEPRRWVEFQSAIVDLTERFGLYAYENVERHVLLGEDIQWRSWSIVTEPDYSRPLPSVTIRVYTAPALLYLARAAPPIFKGAGVDMLSDMLPFGLGDVDLYEPWWDGPSGLELKSGDEVWGQGKNLTAEDRRELIEHHRERSEQRQSRRQAPITNKVRVRAWFCYYSSTDGGGPLSWTRGEVRPSTLWHELYWPSLGGSELDTAHYWSDIRVLLALQRGWLLRAGQHWSRRRGKSEKR